MSYLTMEKCLRRLNALEKDMDKVKSMIVIHEGRLHDLEQSVLELEDRLPKHIILSPDTSVLKTEAEARAAMDHKVRSG